MNPGMLSVDVVVIGSGSGGLAACSGLAKLNIKTLLVEQSSIGGNSLHSGSIPSNTLFNCASVAKTLRNAKKMGFDCKLQGIRCDTMQEYIAKVVTKIKERESASELSELGIRVIAGQASFLSPNVIRVGQHKIKAKKIIIAAGGYHSIPRIPGLKDAGFINSATFLSSITILQDIIILAKDVEGIEFAQAFARLGAKVRVIVPSESILVGYDSEMVWHLRGLLEYEGVEFFTNVEVLEVNCDPNRKKKRLSCRDNEGQDFILETQEIFLSQGMVPNIASLQLARAGVEYNQNGIIVDKYFRTSKKHIYAIGEVTDIKNKGSHITEHQATVVVNHIILKIPYWGRQTLVPKTIYTDPEYVEVGLTEDDVIARNIKGVKILRSNFRDNDRAITLDRMQGKVKLLVKNRRILGASILGPHASELISQFSLSIRLKIPVEEIALNILPYPSLSRGHRRALTDYLFEEKLVKIVEKISNLKQKVF